MKYVALLLTIIGYAESACPNGCSGHGTCGVDEVVSELILTKHSILLIFFDSFAELSL